MSGELTVQRPLLPWGGVFYLIQTQLVCGDILHLRTWYFLENMVFYGERGILSRTVLLCWKVWFFVEISSTMWRALAFENVIFCAERSIFRRTWCIKKKVVEESATLFQVFCCYARNSATLQRTPPKYKKTSSNLFKMILCRWRFLWLVCHLSWWIRKWRQVKNSALWTW